MGLKVGLDIDDCLADFINPYIRRFGKPKNDYEITKNVFRKLRNDKDFWLSLPKLNTLDFTPELYCTKRVNSKNWTKQWLNSNGFSNRPVYQMYHQKGNKADMIKGRVNLFIDDSLGNFIQMNLSGVPCLLYNKDYNKHWNFGGRIYSLDISHIEDTYHNFMRDTFLIFDKLVNDFTRNKINSLN